MQQRISSYLLLEDSELEQRAEAAVEHLARCDLCPRECRAERLDGKMGSCKTSRQARVSSFFPHHGEEDPLRGTRGSGTIFFSNCNLRCQYCQNHEISQEGQGQIVSTVELATMMLHLQNMGCHNINFVSPTHVVAQIIEAVALAAQKGLHIPLVYNTGGYDAIGALSLLDGIIDIYMPDMKYADAAVGLKYSQVKDYPQHNRTAVKEMFRQVGDLVLDERGIAQRGLLVRHLVLPGGLAGTAEIARFLVEEVSRNTYINIMGQYRPEYRARTTDIGPLSRSVTANEIAQAYVAARKAGLQRFDERRRIFTIDLQAGQ
ncbi:MAG: radical SAM protein [Anaerolineae bacterium]|nr:radical SAM protein [Anaerolineae bacterium]